MSENREIIDVASMLTENPLTKLSGTYQSKLVEKIKNKFTSSDHQIFLMSFSCYLNCGPNDYVFDLDNIWKVMGFARKDPAKLLIEKHFTENKDYIKDFLLHKSMEQKKSELIGGRGGHNKDKMRS